MAWMEGEPTKSRTAKEKSRSLDREPEYKTTAPTNGGVGVGDHADQRGHRGKVRETNNKAKTVAGGSCPGQNAKPNMATEEQRHL